MATIARVFIIRHGETKENSERIIQGQLDTKLNDKGIRQARQCAERLKDEELIAAYTSDLQRAAKTAEIILEHHPSVRLVKDARIRERNLGVRQGRKYNRDDRGKTHEGEEPREAFSKRAMEWWHEAIANPLPEYPDNPTPHNILVVSHGAFISMLIRTLCAKGIIEPLDGCSLGTARVHNTSVTLIEMRRDKRGVLVKYADKSHLEEKAVEYNVDEDIMDNPNDK